MAGNAVILILDGNGPVNDAKEEDQPILVIYLNSLVKIKGIKVERQKLNTIYKHFLTIARTL